MSFVSWLLVILAGAGLGAFGFWLKGPSTTKKVKTAPAAAGATAPAAVKKKRWWQKSLAPGYGSFGSALLTLVVIIVLSWTAYLMLDKTNKNDIAYQDNNFVHRETIKLGDPQYVHVYPVFGNAPVNVHDKDNRNHIIRITVPPKTNPKGQRYLKFAGCGNDTLVYRYKMRDIGINTDSYTGLITWTPGDKAVIADPKAAWVEISVERSSPNDPGSQVVCKIVEGPPGKQS